MKINQLFREKPPESIVIKLLSAFGLKAFDDDTFFCKNDLLNKHNTIDILNNLKSELERFYIPCKAKIYLSNITCKTALTILRQFIRLYSYQLDIRQKYVKYKKIIFYRIQPVKEENADTMCQHIKFDQQTFSISF